MKEKLYSLEAHSYQQPDGWWRCVIQYARGAITADGASAHRAFAFALHEYTKRLLAENPREYAEPVAQTIDNSDIFCDCDTRIIYRLGKLNCPACGKIKDLEL